MSAAIAFKTLWRPWRPAQILQTAFHDARRESAWFRHRWQSRSPPNHSIVETVRSTGRKPFPPRVARPARIVRVAPDDTRPRLGTRLTRRRKAIVRLKVRINIGVIVFERGNDQIIGMVMKKLGPAVPECGLILVAFKNELFLTAKP